MINPDVVICADCGKFLGEHGDSKSIATQLKHQKVHSKENSSNNQ